jgi:hypothetical protein
MPGNHVLLETINLTKNAASVTFDNIPQTGYTDLKVDMSVRGTTAQIYTLMDIWFNGSTTGFSSKGVEGNGSGVSSYNNSSIYLNAATGANATANTFSSNSVYIFNYTSSNFKSVSVDGVLETNATTAYASLQAGLWSNTATITSIQIIPRADSLAAGSTFSLYGVAAFGTTPAIAPKATGGNIVANDGTYWYHAFLSSGYFVPQTPLTNVDYLVVAGGGSGGTADDGGGGGGAGGLRSTVTASGGGGNVESKLSLAIGNYPVTVGAGGNGVQGSNGTTSGVGRNGSNSVFSTITAIGGGGGGGITGAAALAGGSGGGGGQRNSSPGGLGTTNQGFAGGSTGSANDAGGGGGGSGAVGTNASGGNVGGAGGAGVLLTAFATPTNTGVSGYYAGGGGGGGASGQGAAGAGGGGVALGLSAGGSAGTAGTGGGGGAGNAHAEFSGNGGSGIVIIRYAMV